MPLPRKPYSTTGPHEVAVQDLEFSTGGTELSPDNHVVGRLFYPAAPGSSKRWFTPTCFWLPHRTYALGYATFLFFWARDKGLKYTVLKHTIRGIIWALGTLFQIPATWNAPLTPPTSTSNAGKAAATATSNGTTADGTDAEAGVSEHFPLVIFSHGLAGTRNTYSCMCSELASQGFVVFAVEHADGTASTARLAHKMSSVEGIAAGTKIIGLQGTWRLYGGMGEKAVYTQKTRWRVRELMTSLRLLRDMNEGKDVAGLHLSGPTPANTFLKGRLDMSRVAAVGHSFGGATVALAASEYPEVRCAVALDPWWDALPADCSMLAGTWRTPSPMLVIGSHEWNKPKLDGTLACNGERQEIILRAAATGSDLQGPSNGPGALLFVPRGSTHHSYDDVLLFYGGALAPIIKKFNFHAELSAELGISIISRATAHFMRTHLHASPGTAAHPLASPEPLMQQHVGAYTEISGEEHVAILKLAAC